MSEADNKNKVFRKVALDRLSSPEQLDTMMRIITPKAWLALSPLLFIIGIGIVWSIFGAIPYNIEADKCILINPNGLSEITSQSAGRLQEMNVSVGDEVSKGTQVAILSQPKLEEQIKSATSKVRELEALSSNSHTYAEQSDQLTEQMLIQNKAVLEKKIGSANERASFARERARIARDRLKVQKDLYSQELVTQQSVLLLEQEAANYRQEEVAANLEIQTLRSEVERLKLTKLERNKQSNSEKVVTDTQLNEAQRELDRLLEEQRITGVVESQYDGRIIEIKARKGMLVNQGESIVTVERSEIDNQAGSLEAYIFVPVGEGKKIRAGMMTHIVPSTVKREEHGFIFGAVNTVSDYPASPSSMKLKLQNDELVRDLYGRSPPTQIVSKLDTSQTFSGLKWSSADGPQVKISSGTICKAQITIQKQRPISLVIPILKSSLGID